MAEISIGVNHLAQVARAQHVLEWLSSERARLESEHAHVVAHVVAAGERVQGELLHFLHDVYGVDPAASLTIDADRGVLVVPDAPTPSDAPAESAETLPASE